MITEPEESAQRLSDSTPPPASDILAENEGEGPEKIPPVDPTVIFRRTRNRRAPDRLGF